MCLPCYITLPWLDSFSQEKWVLWFLKGAKCHSVLYSHSTNCVCQILLLCPSWKNNKNRWNCIRRIPVSIWMINGCLKKSKFLCFSFTYPSSFFLKTVCKELYLIRVCWEPANTGRCMENTTFVCHWCMNAFQMRLFVSRPFCKCAICQSGWFAGQTPSTCPHLVSVAFISITVLHLHFDTMATRPCLADNRQCCCVWVAFPPPLQSSFSSASNQNSEMQNNIGTMCNSTCVKCSHSSVPGGNLLSNALKQKDICVQKWLYSASREYSRKCCYIFLLLEWNKAGERFSFVSLCGSWLPGYRRPKHAFSL